METPYRGGAGTASASSATCMLLPQESDQENERDQYQIVRYSGLVFVYTKLAIIRGFGLKYYVLL